MVYPGSISFYYPSFIVPNEVIKRNHVFAGISSTASTPPTSTLRLRHRNDTETESEMRQGMDP